MHLKKSMCVIYAHKNMKVVRTKITLFWMENTETHACLEKVRFAERKC